MRSSTGTSSATSVALSRRPLAARPWRFWNRLSASCVSASNTGAGGVATVLSTAGVVVEDAWDDATVVVTGGDPRPVDAEAGTGAAAADSGRSPVAVR